MTSPNTATTHPAELTALFQAGVAGDAARYGEFLQAVSAILRRAITRKLPSADLEDVLQEILISVHKARHTYDGERPLMPWLSAIAQFRVNDHLRKLYGAAAWERLDIAVDVTETASDSEYMDDLLNPVGERDRQILTLMHIEGHTAKETGRRLGMSESAVKVAAHRAIKKIREQLRL